MQGWQAEQRVERESTPGRDGLSVLVVAAAADVVSRLAERLGRVGALAHAPTCAIAERMLRATTTTLADLPPMPGRGIDVVLLDPRLGDVSGLEAIDRLRRAAPTIPVVVVADSGGWFADGEDGLELLALDLLARGAQELVAVDQTSPRELARLLERAIARHSVVAALERSREAAAHRATHDPLTGLPNRQLFLDRLEQAITLGARYGRKTGVLFIDLDDFKQVNDCYGHAVGDLLLASIAARLSHCVRKSDAVGRLGGDEFTVLLPDVRSRRDLLHVQRTITAALQAPHDLGQGLVLPSRASIGVAMAPLDGETPRALLEAADAAMYRAKQLPPPSMRSPSSGEFAMRPGAPLRGAGGGAAQPIREGELRDALAGGEFTVHYQPIVDAMTERVVAAEALLRWASPRRGLLPAGAFLPLAEDTGLIVPIGDIVLEAAARAARGWQQPPGARDDRTPPVRVHVNLSAVQLGERDLAARVARALHAADCPAELLTLEVSERMAMPDQAPVLDTLAELRRLGVRLVLDDFGVGSASLAFLREAPIHAMKIDRSFIARLTTDSRDVAIVAAMVRMARGLGLAAIAEGVETEAQARLLRFQRCGELQGWLFGEAVAPDVLAARLGAPAMVAAPGPAAIAHAARIA
jgi:diguanylate cyclase (GGDEF)-like protein